MTGELLFEIGTEEIPSDYLDNALNDLARLADNSLEENRLGSRERLMTLGTPRRLVLMVNGLAGKQADALEEITGPPKKAGFDEGGQPTRAAIGFAQRHGVAVEDLNIQETPRGAYLSVRKRTPGRPTREVLSEILPKLVSEIPWPKSMRWGDLGFSFVRPIHWIVALLDGEVIPFEVAGVKSADQTWGHRFMAPQSFQVRGTEDYLSKMRAAFVLVDREERAFKIREGAMSAARTLGGTPVLDPELLATVTNMVEFPSTVRGDFDRDFLQLPDPVLITAMKKHQKYFAVRDSQGRLMPHFVAVNNTTARDETVVRKGHERVLRARLSDADFFFRQDRKKPLQARLEDLKGVIYQAQLGTSFAKVQRFTRLAEYLCERVAPELKREVSLAAGLCKCDLVTEMVTEFPELQGVMGKEYARLDGHSETVCLAIHEHYLPAHSGDELPSSPAGAIVGLADRMDTVTGFFAIGMEPTGAADPFALRRHALAVIRILEEREWDISLREFVLQALSALRQEVPCDETSVFERVIEFFRQRYKQMMLRSDYSPDLVEAVISAEFDRLPHLHHRLGSLKKFIAEFSDLEPLALTFKRMVNILKNQTGGPSVRPALLKEPSELHLWKSYQGIRDDFHSLIEDKKYLEALNLLVSLKKPVDGFFEGVEVLTRKDEELRTNRVALLKELTQLFLSIADFSKLAI